MLSLPESLDGCLHLLEPGIPFVQKAEEKEWPFTPALSGKK